MASKYKKVDQREHVLLRPGMYIGSTEPDRIKTWIEANGKFEKKEIDYVPGLYKIYDEILVNALDQVRLEWLAIWLARHNIAFHQTSILSSTSTTSPHHFDTHTHTLPYIDPCGVRGRAPTGGFGGGTPN